MNAALMSLFFARHAAMTSTLQAPTNTEGQVVVRKNVLDEQPTEKHAASADVTRDKSFKLHQK